jgi:protein-L-isoaspartate(D-aspartate) O-methyltransferase
MNTSHPDDPQIAAARQRLFRQLRERGIAGERVLQAMMAVPREMFVSSHLQQAAYDDSALPTAHGQSISQPAVVAIMTEALQVEPDNLVLEIGTGSGYQAAILSRLARHVVTIERFADLAERARDRLKKLGFTNVTVITGDGSSGVTGFGQFDRILVTAASPSVPENLLRLLKPEPESRVVIPVGDQSSQDLQVINWTPSGWKTANFGPVRFVPLRGESGWSDDDWHSPGMENGE